MPAGEELIKYKGWPVRSSSNTMLAGEELIKYKGWPVRSSSNTRDGR
jgi:hypothetical protein